MTTPYVLRFRIPEMDCMEEVAVLRRAVGPMVGGEERLSFDVVNRQLAVDINGLSVTRAEIMEAVAKTGMRAEEWTDDKSQDNESDARGWSQSQLWTSLSGAFLAVALLLRAALSWELASGSAIEVAEQILLAGAIICGLWLVVPKAIRAAKRLRPDMNLLMFAAVIGAVIIGEHLEAASVAFLFALAEALERWSTRRAHRAITALLDLSPAHARLLQPDGTEESRLVQNVPVGSRIIVKPGERIPLDGTVAAGSSQVNQAPITGESIPVGKRAADVVFAGTVNGNGALEIETTRSADDTTMAHIVRMVEQARTRRSPSERWVERFARYYTPAVMGVALAVFMLPPLLMNASWSDWFYRSLVLLVIACPCALVISTPVCIVAALTIAARQGVLIKGGLYVEAPAHLQAIALDKTGTLTEGRPCIKEIVPLNGHSEYELLERVSALEARSRHPLAAVITEHALAAGIKVTAAEDYQEIPGKGASGRWNGNTYWLGSVGLLRERGQQTPEIDQRIATLADRGQTVVVVGDQRHVCGLLALADAVRPTARHALAELKAAGIQHIIMLTGDNTSTAKAIAHELGIDEIRAELLPAEKVRAVEELVTEYQSVAMVGDGVNDAPALATASLGIAMGVAGSDAAIETADIALMSNDLRKLPWLVKLSRRTLGIIQQNIWFALAVKLAFAVLAFAGYSTLWGAIAADMGASLLVIFNGMRLLHE